MLELYVVYFDPLDFPGKFVCRKWILNKPTNEHWTADRLTDLYEFIPDGLARLERSSEDDPSIVEVWI